MCGNALFLKLQKLNKDHDKGTTAWGTWKFACEPFCLVSLANRKVRSSVSLRLMLVLVMTHWKTKVMTQLVTQNCSLVIRKTTKTTQKTMSNQTVRKWTALSNIVMRYCLSETVMSDSLRYKSRSEYRYIQALTINVGGGGGCYNFWEIRRGSELNLPLLAGGHDIIEQLPVLLVQLVIERCTGIAEVKGSNPVQAWIFSGFLFAAIKVASITAVIFFTFNWVFLQYWWQSFISEIWLPPIVQVAKLLSCESCH